MDTMADERGHYFVDTTAKDSWGICPLSFDLSALCDSFD